MNDLDDLNSRITIAVEKRRRAEAAFRRTDDELRKVWNEEHVARPGLSGLPYVFMYFGALTISAMLGLFIWNRAIAAGLPGFVGIALMAVVFFTVFTIIERTLLK